MSKGFKSQSHKGKQKKRKSKKSIANDLHPSLDTLLKDRYHGAVNIRGIRYQILYSVFHSFELYNNPHQNSSIRLEGIEDLDYLNIDSEDKYIQVKTADKPWNWAKLKEPIGNFAELLRVSNNCQFSLVVNFELQKDIKQLAEINSLSTGEQETIKRKFYQLCNAINISEKEAEAILGKLEIIYISEADIWNKLRLEIANRFNLGSHVVDTYIFVLVSKFLNWAETRANISRNDLEKVRISIEEYSAREEYQAYGRGLIDKISWKIDPKTSDFFEGKDTRPGQIAAGVDVKREQWLDKIDRAIHSAGTCILKSSSGQGKSTLMYRYARDYWREEDTLILKAAKSVEQAESIKNYLQFRSSLGIPLLLLIDDAGWQTKQWSTIAQECVALGIRVLVTVRHEDWYRFSRKSLTNWEVLEPSLALDEAKEIFNTFKVNNRIHQDVLSAEWAYEKIGEPHLLMEYTYLLTYGEMLEDRLRDQIQQFRAQNEDPGKIEILRRVALAHTLRTPVIISHLLENISSNSDPQEILQSLSQEYIQFQAENITGLHWVRSNHLTKILHENYPNMVDTALKTIDAIPRENLVTFISNAISKAEFDVSKFLVGLTEQAIKSEDLKMILLFLDGIFKGGEKYFFNVNRSIFYEAHEHLGTAGSFFLDWYLTAIPNSLLDKSLQNLSQNIDNFRYLEQLKPKFEECDRGLDLCKEFLLIAQKQITLDEFRVSFGDLGKFFDWCYLCQIQINSWSKAKEKYLIAPDVINISLDEFCRFSQGLYRYSPIEHKSWFADNEENIIGYLKLSTDSIYLEISEEVLFFKFIVPLTTSDLGYSEAKFRLDTFRSAIPFCQRYKSQGTWLSLFQFKPSWDDTQKNIPVENFPFDSDAQKNRVLMNIVGLEFSPDSYYSYQQGWYNIRSKALKFAKKLSQLITKHLTHGTADIRDYIGQDILTNLDKALTYYPSCFLVGSDRLCDILPQPLVEVLLKNSSPNCWFNDFHLFFYKTYDYLRKGNQNNLEIAKIAFYSLKSAINNLPNMHEAFSQLFEHSPDYFNCSALDKEESKYYSKLADVFELLILDRPLCTVDNIEQYIKNNKEIKRTELLKRIKNDLSSLTTVGITILFPSDVHIEIDNRIPLRYLCFAFSVNDPFNFDKYLSIVIVSLYRIQDVADFFCLIPTYKGNRFLTDGWIISSSQLNSLQNLDDSFNWETLMARKLPNFVWNYLPSLPFEEIPSLIIKSEILAIFLLLNNLIDEKAVIEKNRLSNNSYEQKLYEQYLSKLRDYENNSYQAICNLKERFECIFVAQVKTQNYNTIFNFINNVSQALSKHQVETLLDSNLLSMQEQVSNALEKLCLALDI